MSAHGYIVRFESKGKLYVEYNDRVIKIANPFDYVPEAIELVRVENELYIKGFEPKIEKEQKESEYEYSEAKEEVGEFDDKVEDRPEEAVEEKSTADFDWFEGDEQSKKKGGSKKKSKK